MGERTPAETAFLHFLSALYRLSMQSCAPTQSAFSYPLSFRRLCQHSFPLPLPVATVNSFVLSCYGTTNISHPVPAGHTYPLRCFAPQWARFDNRHSTSAPDPTLAQRQRQRRRRYKQSPEPTTIPAVPIPRSQHRQICTCLPRAKGSLNRRFEWFSLVPFFLQKKKGTRAGARNTPACARRQCPPNIPAASAATYPLRCSAPQWARFDNRHSTSAPDPTLAQRQRQRRRRYKQSPEPTTIPAVPIPRDQHRQFCMTHSAPRDP
mgnify:CR=1 FL=1